jgi:hypothetical protein
MGEYERCVKSLWKQATLSIPAPMGNQKEVCLPGTLKDSKRLLGKRGVSLW